MLIVAVLMIATSASIYMVSSFRGILIGESLWSKAQKDAVFYLSAYVNSRDPDNLKQFHDALKVPAGDRAAITALERSPADLQAAYHAVLQGGIHPEDAHSVIWLLHTFRDASWMREPMEYWGNGDRYLEQLKRLSLEIESKHSQGLTTAQDIDTWNREIAQINNGVTPASTAFSASLSATSRRITLWLLAFNCALALGMVLLWTLISRQTLQARRQAYAELTAEKERAGTTLVV